MRVNQAGNHGLARCIDTLGLRITGEHFLDASHRQHASVLVPGQRLGDGLLRVGGMHPRRRQYLDLSSQCGRAET